MPASDGPEPRRLQQPAPTRSRRNTFGCNLVNLGNYDIADKIREPALERRDRQAGRVELGV
jgi:hypothetical protein